MLKLAAIAAVGAISAAVGAQAMISLAHTADAGAQTQAAEATTTGAQPAAPVESSLSDSAATVSKAEDGHYWADASVDGRQIHFLVDTGASAVALTPGDAERLGIDPSSLNYAVTVSTAGGQTHAARVSLQSVAVAGAEVDNVEAFVVRTGLEHSLLGMTYLGRLSRFEATPTALILRP
ncbi:MAG TPA: TIGR02281 family clan AA aspartic protease [Caulobacteraceae bacterium]|nr:TIGR02281 family clan AA aspartic protease [Caulobacteraceae bacterium]